MCQVEYGLYFADLTHTNIIRSAFFSISSIAPRFIPKALNGAKTETFGQIHRLFEFALYALYKGLIKGTIIPPLCTKQATSIAHFSTVFLHKCKV
jgi:hypothetical protein